MTPSRKLVGLLLVLGVGAGACRHYLPSNRYLQRRDVASSTQSTADARHKFNHARHAKVMETVPVACTECHRFDVLIDTANADLAMALSAQALYPGGAACHACHRTDGAAHMEQAPPECTTCHDNLLPLLPEDHYVAWLKVHATAATTNSTACEKCHRQAFCIDCHSRRDTVQTVYHERNFKFFHSVQARANPMQCGSCHRQDFCINCHTQGKVD
jgi:hypothetical protein